MLTTCISLNAGTSGFPKPIKCTTKGLINLSNILRTLSSTSCSLDSGKFKMKTNFLAGYGELDLANKRVAAHTNPLFRKFVETPY